MADTSVPPPRSKTAIPSIVLTSHPRGNGAARHPPEWGAADPQRRQPVIASATDRDRRNAIGAHGGAYSLYRALAVASGQLRAEHRPDLTDTRPAEPIGPFPQWSDPSLIVSLDPWGHMITEAYAAQLAAGWDVRPTIAVTRARIQIPELRQAMDDKRLAADGAILSDGGDARVTKIAIEPVWWLPGIASRFSINETELRRVLFEQTGGMFPELVTRPDLKVFLPPIGGTSVYLFGDPAKLGRTDTSIACRIHDECNGSDVFGSDVCTCRPYLAHGIEECVRTAQRGGVGIIVYNRKEGRALGEVTKFLVYNARKRQPGGDRASAYFLRTECVAGVQDLRFQELMPDVLHWLGVSRIDRLVSMSNMKFKPLVESGIEVVERVPIPDELVPADAQVEIDAKKAAGYHTDSVPGAEELELAKGRGLQD
jgi:GTP cyclohydrolase II